MLDEVIHDATLSPCSAPHSTSRRAQSFDAGASEDPDTSLSGNKEIAHLGPGPTARPFKPGVASRVRHLECVPDVPTGAGPVSRDCMEPLLDKDGNSGLRSGRWRKGGGSVGQGGHNSDKISESDS